MPNCDWGKPCDCLYCCTVIKNVICPHCRFENYINVIRNAEGTTDRKGMFYYKMTEPSGTKDLTCFHCQKLIPNAPEYHKINTHLCEINVKKLTARTCVQCGRYEGIDRIGFKKIVLRDQDGHLLCPYCIEEIISKNDPSTKTEKYVFNRFEGEWKLAKVKKPCVTCGRHRWLAVENQWKKQCITCYRSR